MSDSKNLALDLLSDLNKIEDFGPAEAQAVATLSVTLAINELRKELRLVRENSEATVGCLKNIGSAADATAGFTSDIAAALVDPDLYDDGEDYEIDEPHAWHPRIQPFADFANLRIA